MSRYRLRWWQAWAVVPVAAILLPFPWSIVVAASFAVWAGWTLVER